MKQPGFPIVEIPVFVGVSGVGIIRYESQIHTGIKLEYINLMNYTFQVTGTSALTASMIVA